MSRWADKDAFMSWIKEERRKAKYDPFSDKGYHTPEEASAYANVYLFEEVVDDETLTFFNDYFWDVDIPIYYFEQFILTVEQVRYAEKLKIPHTIKDFKYYIDRIKRNADELQTLSEDQITLRLPTLPQDSIRVFMDHLGACGLAEEYRLLFLEYFGQDRLPRTTKDLKSKEEMLKAGIPKHEIKYYKP